MIELIFIVVAIVVFVKFSRLDHAIKKIESELAVLKGKKSQSTETIAPHMQSERTPSAMMEYATSASSSVASPSDFTRESSKPEQPNELVAWFKENPLLKIGVLMILAGFGWFVSYAFAHNWIGPVGRISIGVVVGTLVTLAGTWRLAKNQVQGSALTILGTALIIMTVLAGQYYYTFFGSSVVLGIIFIVSLYTSLSAVAYNTEKLAVYGIIISLLAPILSGVESTHNGNIYLYLGVISITTIWISVAKGWRHVVPIGITGILLYSVPELLWSNLGNNPAKYFILFITYGISLMYLIIGVASLINNKLQATADDVYIALVNTAIILGFTHFIIPTTYQSLVITAWMIIYAISGFIVFTRTKNEKLFYVHALISIFLLAVATSIELSGQTLVIAFAIEAAIIVIASFVVTEKIKISESFVVLLAGPFVMSLQSLTSAKWGSGIIHSDFAVLVVMAVIFASLGVFYRMNKEGNSSDTNLSPVMFIVSTFYVYALVWLCSHSLILNSDSAVFVSLLFYTIVGLACHFYGLFNQNAILKKYGMAILILVVVRLVLVDVWRMELVLRVVTFIVLGIMFMSSAFISKNQKPVAPVINN